MANNIKLIDFSALGEVANNLINKLAAAIGWTVVHDTPKKIALATYIDDIKNSNLQHYAEAGARRDYQDI